MDEAGLQRTSWPLFLQSRGLIVRRVDSYGLPHCLRITVGDESACRRVGHAVRQFKGGS